YWLLMSELFPMKIRGALAGTAVCFQWICNATVAFAFPLLLSVIGNQTFFLFVLLNIGSFIFVFFMLPETRGKSLEEIENMMRSKYGEV
ncbi:MAG TPA: MFS transporter, partial [Erwiniaceae bacterium]|nr:MFS transporter [Erwiniaceae bacterium]